MAEDAEQAERIPAQPYPSRTSDSVWSRASSVRDSIYARFTDVCASEHMDTLVHKSLDFEYPAWVLLEAWLPLEGSATTDRVRLLIEIEPRPQSTYEFVYTIRCLVHGRERIYGPYHEVGDEMVGEWVKYVLGRAQRPPIRQNRLRGLTHQIWYPRNKILGITRDPLTLLIYAAVLAGLVAMTQSPPAGVGLLILAAVLAIVRMRRYPVFINPGRPEAEPRSLRLVDSWQTVIGGLGAAWTEARERLHAQLNESQVPGIKTRLENISYLTPDGKQEREQIALHLGRGVVFCHFYPYGDDRYVGWEAFMNYGAWEEFVIARGYDRRLRKPVVINNVRPVSAMVTEYDLIDLNAVTEWTHTRLVNVLRRLVAEHKIDQEIDFQIMRGERQSLLKTEGTPDRTRGSSGGRAWAAGGPAPRLSRTA